MAYCKNCGMQLNNDSNVCLNCGTYNAPNAETQQYSQPYQQPQYAPPKTEPMAIASLVMGILSLVTYYGAILLGILAIVFARSAKQKIADSNGRREGLGMAKAGMIMGIIGLAVWGAIILMAIGLVSCAGLLM